MSRAERRTAAEQRRSARKARRAAAAATREQRKRDRDREDSQPQPLDVRRLARPAQRPGHQASTAHVQAAYPAVAEAGLGSRGVYVGRDLHGGSFVYDPWVLYGRRLLTNANTIVIGQPGYGKSSLSKSYLWRQRVFGRRIEAIDPKGEYAPLIEAMGGSVLRLEPGGTERLNPLAQIGPRAMREGLLEAVTTAMLERQPDQAEAVGLAAALAAGDERAIGRETTIPDVIESLRNPEDSLCQVLNMTADQARDGLRDCALALQRLQNGPLRGMFDGPTTAGDELWDGPALALDLSAFRAGAASSNLALGIMMVCATQVLDTKRLERAAAARAEGRPLPKTVRVNDEGWRALPIAGLGDYYQSAFKLSRETGVQHWMVLHRLSDLRAAGDSGTRQQQLAEGLLSDASTIVVYHQHPKEVPTTTDLLALSSTEASLIAGLGDGQALWRVGGRSFAVQHVLSDIEWPLCQTDAAMADDELEPEEALDVDEALPARDELLEAVEENVR